MSAACCTGHYRYTNKFTIIHFDDGIVSEGSILRVFIFLKYHVCKFEGSEYNAVKN